MDGLEFGSIGIGFAYKRKISAEHVEEQRTEAAVTATGVIGLTNLGHLTVITDPQTLKVYAHLLTEGEVRVKTGVANAELDALVGTVGKDLAQHDRLIEVAVDAVVSHNNATHYNVAVDASHLVGTVHVARTKLFLQLLNGIFFTAYGSSKHPCLRKIRKVGSAVFVKAGGKSQRERGKKDMEIRFHNCLLYRLELESYIEEEIKQVCVIVFCVFRELVRALFARSIVVVAVLLVTTCAEVVVVKNVLEREVN